MDIKKAGRVSQQTCFNLFINQKQLCQKKMGIGFYPRVTESEKRPAVAVNPFAV